MWKYIIYLSVFIGLVFLAQGLYKHINTSYKLKALPCQKEVVVFDRVYEKKLLAPIIEQIYMGNFQTYITAQKAIYTKSDLFEYVQIDAVKNLIDNELNRYLDKALHVEKKPLHVNVLLYENDKNDPGKKNEEAKVYRGYLVFSFILENVLVYKVQIDFMDYEGKDIQKRVSCAIETLLSYKEAL